MANQTTQPNYTPHFFNEKIKGDIQFPQNPVANQLQLTALYEVDNITKKVTKLEGAINLGGNNAGDFRSSRHQEGAMEQESQGTEAQPLRISINTIHYAHAAPLIEMLIAAIETNYSPSTAV